MDSMCGGVDLLPHQDASSWLGFGRHTNIDVKSDSSSLARPLDPHDDAFLESMYTSAQNPDDGAPAAPSTIPASFTDAYLWPTLNEHERLRLSTLWYMMRDAMRDPDLVSRLQNQVDLVRDIVDWEYCVMGIVDSAEFVRVAAAGLPCAVMPRRESPCSHTINTHEGSIFWISDMSKDWRFRGLPQVAEGGLRSYAGTSLAFHTMEGTRVALGSLCVASSRPDMRLTMTQATALKKVAQLLVTEIVTHRRLQRHQQREEFIQVVSMLEANFNCDDFEGRLLNAIRKSYPTASVSLSKGEREQVKLSDGSLIPVDKFQHGLWDNAELLNRWLATENQVELTTDQAIRAVFSRTGPTTPSTFLVVETRETRCVFDDVDVWYIEKCARLVEAASQHKLLKALIETRESFFRGMTHQLRTPIHGILGAAELLAEDLNLAQRNWLRKENAAQRMLSSDSDPIINSSTPPLGAISGDVIAGRPTKSSKDGSSLSSANLAAVEYLEAIKSSGQELMSVINNVLKFNKWTDLENICHDERITHERMPYDMREMETDLASELEESLLTGSLMGVSLVFQNRLETRSKVSVIDAALLRDCIKAVLTNAIQCTPHGLVTMTLGRLESVLTIDIADNGIGIPKDHQDSIFEPYSKVDQHTRGAGLGLTLAARTARALGGQLSLVRSEVGVGSHFRFVLPDAGFEEANTREDESALAIPANVSMTANQNRPAHPLTAILVAQLKDLRILDSDSQHDGNNGSVQVPIINFNSNRQDFEATLADELTPTQAFCIVPSRSYLQSLRANDCGTNVRFFHGPLTSSKLSDIARELAEHQKSVDVTTRQLDELAISPGLTDKPITPQKQPPVALLVDDNPINLKLLAIYCRKRGIPYHEATDGEQAVKTFQNTVDVPINLILMDLQMPVCDGLEATARIRKFEQEDGTRVPSVLVMITGQDSPRDKQDSIEAGADKFMVKPAKMKRLDELIEAYFSIEGLRIEKRN